ncbi:MAG: hypothetical protein P4L84_22450 [Isosphaeraceae bacterium]|nr:hypothetical protein [Isosphaeraceae bacterium]
MTAPAEEHGRYQVASEPFARLWEGLSRLLEAREQADQAAADPWQFAVPAQGLRDEGLGNSELRILILTAIVSHRIETTGPRDDRRFFRYAAELEVVDRSCFVLTVEGLTLARHHLVAVRHATGPDVTL